jgi:predicted phosphodiesterase
MRILHLSDTHNLHRELQKLPFADVIVHSGDMLMAGAGNEVVDFIDWFKVLDYQYKIFIVGNFLSRFTGKRTDCPWG